MKDNSMNEKVVIVSAPSGAGKTSIVKFLLEKMPQLAFSISATSRPKRANEQHGKDYYFLAVEEFKKKLEGGDFLEWQEVYPNQFYGTLKSEVERLWGEGKIVIFDVDVLGGLNIKKIFGEKALSVFIQPPTVEELKNRLCGRGTETPESLKKRLDKAEYELSFAPQFDLIVVNDVLEDARAESFEKINGFLQK